MARHRLLPARLSSESGGFVPWLPALVGIGMMAGFVIYTVANQVGEPLGYEVPPESSPIVELSPSGTPPSEPPATSPPPSPPPSDPPETHPPPSDPPGSHPPPTSPPPPDVVGRYHLVDVYDDVFIGKVVIANTSHHAQDWAVSLAFPDDVGKVLAFWVDGDSQPDGRRLEDNSLLFTSTDPVHPESYVALKIKFARYGGDIDPIRCEVNGTPCIDS